MIPRRILLTTMTILLLLSTFAFAEPDSAGARNDTRAIEVLEERVKGNAEKTKNQIESLQKQLVTQKEELEKLLEAKDEAINQRVADHDDKTEIHINGIQNDMRTRTDSLRDRIDVYLGIAVILLSVLGLVGYATIRKWAKDRIEKMADSVFEKGLTDFKTRATKEVAGLIAEQTAKAEEQRQEFARQAQTLFGKFSTRAVDSDKPVDAADTAELSEYVRELRRTKTEDDYTAEEWFLLGSEADDRHDFEEAVRCFAKSIKLDPSNHWSYFGHGNALNKLGRYKKALLCYDKAIELKPKNAYSYNNRGNTLVRLGRIAEAALSYAKALEIDPEYLRALQNAAEVRIILGQYEDALEHASKALTLSKNISDKATSLYLKCIAERLSGKVKSASVAEFEKVLKDDFVIDWSSDEIEKWLEKAEITKPDREFIEAKTAMLKTKAKKK